MTIPLRRLLPVALWLLVVPAGASGQSADSAKSRAEHARDSTLKVIRRIPLVGSISAAPTTLITDSTINFRDYRYAGDLVAAEPGVFLEDLGSAGQYHGLTIDGLGPRSFTFLADGVLLNDPLTGTFDPYLYPTEHAERIEIITGPRAFLYGIYGAGAVVNFVSRSRKDIHPYSRIRYSEAPYGTGFIDGMFSQDVVRGLNVTGGFSHRTTDGQYRNSNADIWNGRLKLRYNASQSLNVFASGLYNQTYLGLNSGVDLTRTVDSVRFERLQNTLVNTDAYEKVTRYDVQLGAAARLFPDSTAVTTLTLFHTTSLREYRDEENRQDNNGIFVAQDHRSQWYGGRVAHHHELGTMVLDLGAELESRGVIASTVAGRQVKTFGSLFGTVTEKLSAGLSADAFLRTRFAGGDAFIAAGGDLGYTIAPGLLLTGGVARSTLTPPVILEPPARDSLPVAVAADSVHSIAQAGLAYTASGGSSAAVTLTRHIVDYGAVPGLLPSRQLTLDAVEASLGVRAGWLYLRASARHVHPVAGAEVPGPRWSGTGEIYFWDKLAGDHLDLQAGFRVRAFDGYGAITFIQQYQEWVSSADPRIAGAAAVDFVLLAQIGDAHIHLIWENLLDRQYVTASFFPMGERQLRFGISWDLLD